MNRGLVSRFFFDFDHRLALRFFVHYYPFVWGAFIP